MKASGRSGKSIGTALATSEAALLLQFLLQVAAGLYLSRAYIADPKMAHRTMEAVLGSTPHAQIAAFHYWGGAFFIVHSLVHLICMAFAGAFRPPSHWRWNAAVAFFVCAMLFQITGNLLPFDQHGVQTAAVEGGIAASIPGGQSVAKIMMGGEPAMNANTLSTWYFAHRILIPLAILLGTVAGISALFRRGESKPIWLVALVLALIPLAIAFGIPAPLGTAASPDDYNRYNAMVSWYTWPLHGSLEAFGRLDPGLTWIGTAAIPTLFVLFLLLAPLLSKRLATGGIQSIFLIFWLYFLVVAFLFGGKFAPLTGKRDPVVSAVPETTNNAPADPIDRALAERGRGAFNNLPCSGCHGTDGLKPSGGPKLDQVHKEHTDAEWYIEFIKNPKSKKPSSTMPGFPDIGEDNLKAIAEFLRSPR